MRPDPYDRLMRKLSTLTWMLAVQLILSIILLTATTWVAVH